MNTFGPQTQHDKIKRKALLAPNLNGHDTSLTLSANITENKHVHPGHQAKARNGVGIGNNAVDLGAVVGGMEASGASNAQWGRKKFR